MIKKILTLTLLFSFSAVIAQRAVVKPKFLKYSMDSITQVHFNTSLDSLYLEIEHDELTDTWLTPKKTALTKSQLQDLVKYEARKDSTLAQVQDKQLINIYPILKDEYFLSIAYTYQRPKLLPILIYTINLIATKKNDKFTFSIPIDYLTRYWKTQKIGNINYHFRENLNEKRAALFNKKNTSIAKKLGVDPEQMDFYMTDNFQEIFELLGFEYSVFTSGKYRDGYGVDAKTIFAIDGNEDFSHDIFHYYSGKINKLENRNWITEEGVAYLWGNAYYSDKNGEMVTIKTLDGELEKYLVQNPDTDLFELFKNNDKIFTQIASEISVRSTISALIAKKVEKEKGMEGVLELINAGRKDKLDNFLKATNKLIGLNETNFNAKVNGLIENHWED